MENEFSKVMADHSDETLIKIVTADRDKYQPLAIEAAEAEIAKRKIDTTQFEEIREQATQRRQHIEEVDDNLASTTARFVHYLADSIVAYLAMTLCFFFIGLVAPGLMEVPIVFLVIVIGPWFAYYMIMEIMFQKTVGKYIMNTRVVNLDGSKPSQSVIFVRTVCRFIPFDAISYVFMKNGFHDTLSKTKVVKDISTN